MGVVVEVTCSGSKKQQSAHELVQGEHGYLSTGDKNEQTNSIILKTNVYFYGLAKTVSRRLNSLRRVWLLTLLACTLPLFLSGQGKCVNGFVNGVWPCDKVEMMAHVPNVMTGEFTANDLWGWTDPEDGREYVLLGKRNGTWFVEVTNPYAPRVVGKLPTVGLANSLWRDMKVVGDRMVVVSEVLNSRLQVFDLTRLRDHTSPAPLVTFSTDTVLQGFSKAHNVATAPDDPMVYVCGPNGTGGLLAYDFSDPELPFLAGSWDEAYVHDAQVVRYAGADSVHEGRLIAAVSCADDLRLVDVTDPADMFQIASVAHQPHGYIHQGWFSEDHRYFFLGDETDESTDIVEGTHTYVWDLENLDNPVLLEGVNLGTTGTDHNLYVRGDMVFQSNYVDGFRAQHFDPMEPTILSQKAYFDTQPGLDGPGFSGSWSNYPYFDSGTIAVADQTEGLFLIRTSFIRAWPDLLSVCPTDTMELQITLDSCVVGPVAVQLPSGVSWASVDSLPGPGTWPVSLAGYDWEDMKGVTITLTGGGLVHAYRIFVDVTEDAMHFPDADGDGYGTFVGAVSGCSPGPGYAHVGGDCNDADGNIHPGMPDPCDGMDNDCDQTIDEDGISIPFYLDIDGDGVQGNMVFESCTPPAFAFEEPGDDCNDLNAVMYPGAPPTMEGIDNDCNGYILGLEQLDGGCPGDLTGDGMITIQDLLTFLNDFGNSGFLEADLNFDQHVGVADLLLMLGLLGEDC